MCLDQSLQYQSSSLSFTEGFFLGQISVVVLAIFFIKFFIFGESPVADYASRRNGRRLRSLSPSHRRSTSFSSGFTSSSKKISSVLRTSQPLTTASILAKTYYNVNSHQPESLDWFNVLIAQTIAQVRNDAQQDDAILISLTNVLNGPYKPDFVDDIKVTEINLGEEFPIFSNCRIIPVDSGEYLPGDATTRPSSSGGESGAGPRLQARMDVDLSDAITLGIETKLVLNYPKPFVAVMPVALAVSIVRFSGTLSISFIPSSSSPPSTQNMDSSGSNRTPTTLTFSFLPDYRLELSTHSLLGSRSRLQDVPKIAQLVESRLHDWFDERCVEPRFQQVALPSFWPRRSNTRGGQSDDVRHEDGVAANGAIKSGPLPMASTPIRNKGRRDDPSREQAAALGRDIPEKDHNTESESLLSQGLRYRQNVDSFELSPLEGFDGRYRMPGSMPL